MAIFIKCLLFGCYSIRTMIHRCKRLTCTYFTSTSTRFSTPCIPSFSTTHNADSHFHKSCTRIAKAHSLFDRIQSARDSEPSDIQEYLEVIKKQAPFSNCPAISDDNRTINIGSQLDTDMFSISIRSTTQHICPPVVIWEQYVG